MSSADVALVTAKNRRTSIAAAPDLPSNAAAADGAGRPADTSAALRERMLGSPCNATAASPSVVANVKGMANLYFSLNFSHDNMNEKLHTMLILPANMLLHNLLVGLQLLVANMLGR